MTMRLATLMLGAVAFGSMTVSSSASAQSANRSIQQATAVIRAVFAAAERADLAALDTLYAGDSLTVFESAGINRGWKDYRDHHLGPELKEMTGFKYRPIDITTRVEGNLAWATVSYALQAKEGTRTIDNFGRGTYVLERAGSGDKARWVVRHSHTASRARRPNDPPMPQ
ncbi:nuclear transport factor 2 family protein [Gemmatimonas phototrophica]|uniref:SnoaL-like domain-containing protein n=1 Tax=Gemmatimonas phototrophica TaxID=1379270 RepID=A0A143BM81_9BACT|nr:nuclear transport factor 2 family protein [Gemmatimonas phototrophica]AMW05601.1 hypothetical protein GEMMAAP_13870 [Gemmatimonas phototrophica]